MVLGQRRRQTGGDRRRQTGEPHETQTQTGETQTDGSQISPDGNIVANRLHEADREQNGEQTGMKQTGYMNKHAPAIWNRHAAASRQHRVQQPEMGQSCEVGMQD